MKFSSCVRGTRYLAGAPLLAVLSGCGGGSGGSNEASSRLPSATNSITFVSTRDGNAEIYVMSSDGSRQTRLTSNAGQDDAPNKSRSGQRIVFQSDRDGNSEIYAMNFDGSGVQRLTNDTGASPPEDTQPVFSPDGNTIAWTSTRDHADGDTDIWLMDSTGANQRRFITSASGQGSFNPAFSPDGTRLAFFARGPRQRYRDETLTFKNIATGQVTATNFSTYVSRHLRFNPTGTKLIFNDQVPNSNFGRIRIFDIASQVADFGPTAGPATGTNAVNLNPDYSPDGKSIVWDAPNGGASGPNGTASVGQIFVADADGSNVRAITSAGLNSAPDW